MALARQAARGCLATVVADVAAEVAAAGAGALLVAVGCLETVLKAVGQGAAPPACLRHWARADKAVVVVVVVRVMVTAVTLLHPAHFAATGQAVWEEMGTPLLFVGVGLGSCPQHEAHSGLSVLRLCPGMVRVRGWGVCARN